MPNVITIKRTRKIKINRSARGEGIIRIDADAANLLEGLLVEAGGGLSIKDLASELIRYAANDTIIKMENEGGEEESWQK